MPSDAGHDRTGRVSWFPWPFAAVFRLFALSVALVGRLVAGIFGALLIGGLILIVTVIAAPAGIALFAVGFLLFARSIF